MNTRIKTAFKKIIFKARGNVVVLRPKGPSRGSVLISYITLPFINANPKILHGHTNRFECLAMAQIFLKHGYEVDVIDFENENFMPKKKYAYFLDIGSNLERLSPFINKECVKIFHATTSHWAFNNAAEKIRLVEIEKRRGALFPQERIIPPNRSVENTDIILLFGNKATEETYAFAKKQIFRIPISSTTKFSFPEHKDFELAKKSFVWIGGSGPIHKGVDLLLEAFADMPEYVLHLFGKLSNKYFESLYRKELYESPNIKTHGFVDLESDSFKKIVQSSIALISPSCAEGQSGSVIMGMHAGLIPIVSKESGIDTDGYGITLRENTISEIKKTVKKIVSFDQTTIETMSKKAWDYVRNNHTRECFSKKFDNFVNDLEKTKNND